MKKFIPIFILIALGLLLSGCASSESYRYQGAGRSWSINIDKQRPRYGESCVRFELRHGDYWSYASSFRGWTKSHRTERMMLHQAMQGQVYWYGFSMMIPIESSDPQAMTKVGQWHQGTSSGDSPAAEQEWQEKKLSIRIGWETKEVLQFKKGKWFDFVYQFKFGPDGYANVWINGEKFMEFGGTIGTPSAQPYFKYGIYSPNFVNEDEILIVYFDEYRRGNSYEEVDSSHGTGPLPLVPNSNKKNRKMNRRVEIMAK